MPPHKESFDKSKIHLISLIAFLMGFGQSLIVYVLSSYFKTISGTENIGGFYIISYAIVLLVLLNWHKVIRRIGKARVFILAVLAKVAIVVALVFFPPSYPALAILMLYLICGALEWTSLDIILESYSKDNLSGRIRGIHLTIFNAGFIFGPFVSTRILDQYGFQGVFVGLLIMNAIVLVFSLVGLSNINQGYKRDLKIGEIIAKVWKRKNILRIFYISIVLEIFFALLVIYTPIYLLDLGYSWDDIGIMFSMMLIPFVLLQIPIGFLADKKWGEKEMIFVSLFVMALSTVWLFNSGKQTLLFWGGILLLTRVGAAALEILRDSYFYKRIDGYDVDMIDLYKATLPVGYIIANFLAFVALLIFPLKSVFLIVVVVVASALIPAFYLKDNRAECEN
jgi:MFS family permease